MLPLLALGARRSAARKITDVAVLKLPSGGILLSDRFPPGPLRVESPSPLRPGMVQIIDAPVLRHDRKDTSSIIDEKDSDDKEPGSPKVDVKHATAHDTEDVFEDVRDIDLGEDGKERPIGMYRLVCGVRSSLTVPCGTFRRNRPRLRHPSCIFRRRTHPSNLDVPYDFPGTRPLVLRRSSRPNLRELPLPSPFHLS